MTDGIKPDGLYSFSEAANLLSLTVDDIHAAIVDGDFTTSEDAPDLIPGHSILSWVKASYHEMRKREFQESEALDSVYPDDAHVVVGESAVEMTDAEYAQHLVEELCRDNPE